MIGMGSDGVCALWIAERGVQRGQSRGGVGDGAGRRDAPGRRLWTIPARIPAPEDSDKIFVMVGAGTLVGQAATYGETRWSQDRSSVAVVVRRLTGEVAAVVEIRSQRDREGDERQRRVGRNRRRRARRPVRVLWFTR